MNLNLKNKLVSMATASALAIAMILIQNLEGVRYTPYYDVGGVLTVCYGHTGNDIVIGKTYTQKECEFLLNKDLIPFSNSVERSVHVPMSNYQKAALISFSYNVGIYAFEHSSLLRFLNSGKSIAACDGLRKWIYVKGRVWKGMINRRDVEHEVCTWNN